MKLQLDIRTITEIFNKDLSLDVGKDGRVWFNLGGFFTIEELDKLPLELRTAINQFMELLNDLKKDK